MSEHHTNTGAKADAPLGCLARGLRKVNYLSEGNPCGRRHKLQTPDQPRLYSSHNRKTTKPIGFYPSERTEVGLITKKYKRSAHVRY